MSENVESKIALPDAWRVMNAWVDAYTMQLSAIAEANNSAELQGVVAEATKRTAAEAKRTGSTQDILVAENQKMINQKMRSFSLEEHKELMAIWKRVRKDFSMTGWDLGQEIFYQMDQEKKKLHVWQGNEKGGLYFTLAEGGLAVKFLKFVHEHSNQFNPIAYTKQMLEKQGVTKENFHQYADSLAIVNPWLTI